MATGKVLGSAANCPRPLFRRNREGNGGILLFPPFLFIEIAPKPVAWPDHKIIKYYVYVPCVTEFRGRKRAGERFAEKREHELWWPASSLRWRNIEHLNALISYRYSFRRAQKSRKKVKKKHTGFGKRGCRRVPMSARVARWSNGAVFGPWCSVVLSICLIGTSSGWRKFNQIEC